MQRACDGCGKPYAARRSDSKYCSSTCRSKANVAKAHGGVAQLSVPVVEVSDSVYAVTRAQLAEVGRDTSVAGVKALLLARIMGEGGHTGPALAALSKEHSALMVQALDGVSVAADPLDELKARRARRNAG